MNILTKLFLIINNLIAGFVIINNPSYILQKQFLQPRLVKNINMNENYSIEKRENESIRFLHEYAIEKRLKELKGLND